MQVTGFDPVHAPSWQVSVWVQAFPSLQAVPLGRLGLEHMPVVGSHAPAAWHGSLAVQTTGFAPLHTPAWQVSVCVQALPSLQVDPSGRLGLEHVPVVGSHVPAAWHGSLAVQTTGFAPVHTPAWQVSVCVQALPSLQVDPSGSLDQAVVEVAGAQT
jgi:hypothetical protein